MSNVTAVLRNVAGKWVAWATIGVPTRCDTPEEAVRVCLEQAKPYMGMKSFQDLKAAMEGLLDNNP